MTDEKNLYQYWSKINRRFFCLTLFKGVTFFGLGFRLYQLQLLNGLGYRILSDRRRVSLQFIEASRGHIMDSDNQLLVTQRNSFHLLLSLPAYQTYQEDFILSLIPILNLTPSDLSIIQKDCEEGKRVVIKSDLSWSEVSQLESCKHHWQSYARMEVHPVRSYLYGQEFCHILGYVGLSGEEYKKHLPLYIGKYGIEKRFEETLCGHNGYKAVEVNARNLWRRTLQTVEPVNGKPLRTSLSKTLQCFVSKRLAEYKSASCAIIKISTGEVKASVSLPSFDPHIFSKRIAREQWDAIALSENAPLMNKVISGLYPPGSTIKSIALLTALKLGIIDEYSSVLCRGSLTVGDHKFHCWNKCGHGSVNLVNALKFSCDVFFYWLASRIPMDQFYKMALHLGFGQKLDPLFEEEKAGIVPTPQWRWQKYQKSWTVGYSALTFIGQGDFLATPLQLATMMARLKSGRMVKPIFLHVSKKEPFERLDIEIDHLDLIREGLFKVVNNPGGTAYSSRLDENDIQMAGKTGTAQVKKISQKDRSKGITTSYHLPWKFREHSLFCGYAPTRTTGYSFSLVIDHGIKGAANVVKDIVSFMCDEEMI